MAVCPADTNEPPRVLNYLTAPHVYVWSAVSCSSAFPLLFAPQDLKCRNQLGQTVTCAPDRIAGRYHKACKYFIYPQLHILCLLCGCAASFCFEGCVKLARLYCQCSTIGE